MSLAAQGAYRNLLDAEWERGGHLPEKPELLWQLAGARDLAEFLTLWPQIASEFSATDDHRLYNETLLEMLEYAESRRGELHDKRSAAGRQGGIASGSTRRSKSLKTREANASEATKQNEASNELTNELTRGAPSEALAEASAVRAPRQGHPPQVLEADPDSGIRPEMVAQGVMAELLISGPTLLRTLSEQAAHEMAKGAQPDKLRGDMIAAYQAEIESAKANGRTPQKPGFFFGDGDWRRCIPKVSTAPRTPTMQEQLNAPVKLGPPTGFRMRRPFSAGGER